MRTVAGGGKWFPPDLIETALGRETGRRGFREEIDRILTTREREIALLVAEGLSNKQVAERLAIAEGTVRIHLHNIYRKAGIRESDRACRVRARSRAPIVGLTHRPEASSFLRPTLLPGVEGEEDLSDLTPEGGPHSG